MVDESYHCCESAELHLEVEVVEEEAEEDH
jgi:hypothetical protein